MGNERRRPGDTSDEPSPEPEGLPPGGDGSERGGRRSSKASDGPSRRSFGGWFNPPVPWSELERRLSDRPLPAEVPAAAPEHEGAHPDVHPIPGDAFAERRRRPPTDLRRNPPRDPVRDPARSGDRHAPPTPGDGGDSPAWSRKRAPYQPPAELITNPVTNPVTGLASPTTVPEDLPPASERQVLQNGVGRRRGSVPYAELHCHSHFSFLDGASGPEELVEEAVRQGLEALALTDHDGLYGIVRFAEAARELGLPTVFGTELTLNGPVTLADREGPVSRSVVGGSTHPSRGSSPTMSRSPTPGRSGPAPAVTPRRTKGRRSGEVLLAELDLGSSRPDLGGAVRGCTHLVVLARDPRGYALLARAASEAQLRGEKGAPVGTLLDLAATGGTAAAHPADRDHWLVLTGCRKGAVNRALVEQGPAAAEHELRRLVEAFGAANVAVELWDHGHPLDSARNDALAELAVKVGVDLVATNNVHYASPRERALATAMAAVGARCSLDDLDGWLPAAASAHLRSGAEQARRFARYPGVVERAAELGLACAFDLKLVAPNLPPFPCPEGIDEMGYLRRLTEEGAARRYGRRGEERVAGAYDQIDHELALIEQLGFPGYFLVVWDLVDFCRRSDILCQGRGSAANSAVCFALGITNADAVALGLLFERFLSPERDGPPDIDIDIESDRREEVIQYVYAKHGRRHAAQVANVITYRAKSAVRDMAKALGYSVGQQDAWSKQVDRWEGFGPEARSAHREGSGPMPASGPSALEDRLAAGGPSLDSGAGASVQAEGGMAEPPPSDSHPRLRRLPTTPPERGPRDSVTEPSQGPRRASDSIPRPVIELALQVEHAPRHLGIHSGGMVMCDRPVIEVCPVEWARMEGRSVLQWDKDDCAAAGLVKFDLLGLGMLSALHYTIDFVREVHGLSIDDLATIPQDPAVYDMLCEADTIGVFQIESRAQMATLPRLRPRCFYDLVVEVALIRPGPIQGGSVHPYIRRRNGTEPVTYLHPLLEKSLAKTLGVPLFQEQLMQMAIDVAGFTPSEADQLRQAMGSKRSQARMERLHARFVDGTAANGVTPPVAEQIWDKLAAFANYGFPESHSVSFAYLVYASSWFKRYYPAAFCAALLNAQPMGFYSPHSLVQDARRHGVEVLSPDINVSLADASLDFGPEARSGARGGSGPMSASGPSSLEDRLRRAASGCAPAGASAQAEEGMAEPPSSDSSPRLRRLVDPLPSASCEEERRVARSGHPSARPSLPFGGRMPAQPTVRLGLDSVRGLGTELAALIVAEREANGAFRSMEDCARRVEMRALAGGRKAGGLTLAHLEALATAGAFGSLDLDRRGALWSAGAVAQSSTAKLEGIVTGAHAPPLPGMTEWEEASADLWATGVSPDGHPTRFIRERLDELGVVPAVGLHDCDHGSRVWVGGVVTHRQRPATAGGTTFINLEDETGLINVVCSRGCWSRFRSVARSSPALLIRGRLEKVEGVINIVAEKLEPLPVASTPPSRDFR